jgi:hypothetical protein
MNRLARVVGLLSLASLALATAGCGSIYYGIISGGARSKLRDAKALGAEKLAPYEYTYAEAHIREASRKANEASWGDAANLAEEAERAALKAVVITRQRRGLPPLENEEVEHKLADQQDEEPEVKPAKKAAPEKTEKKETKDEEDEQ